MSLSPSHIQQWFRKPGQPGPAIDTQLEEIISQILTYDKDFTSVPHDIFGFTVILILSSKPHAANRLLSTLFKVPEFSVKPPGQLPQFFTGCKFSQQQIVVLELWWRSLPESERPENTPWERGRGVEEAERNHDLGRLEWWNSWTQFGGESKEYPDAHAWKDSDDLMTLSICARMLCQPENKDVPSKEKIEEAFACWDKFFMPSGESAAEQYLIYGCRRIFFLLALYLGRKEKAVEIMKSAYMGEPAEFELDQFLDIPRLYEMLAAAEIAPLKFLEDDGLVMVEVKLLAALNTRIEKGWTPALHGVPMVELLRRFSEAAFFVHRDKYVEQGIRSPKEILCGPRTVEDIAIAEETYGPLPQDVKEMALIADGFHGGWHFAGGGWGGIQKLRKDEYFECELYLGYNPPSLKEMWTTKRREDGSTYEVKEAKVAVTPRRNKWAYVYSVYPVADCDNFVHILCPEEVWSRMQKDMGKEVKKGEYAYMYHANWTDGGKIYSSIRDWIAQMTDYLERDMAARKKAEGSV